MHQNGRRSRRWLLRCTEDLWEDLGDVASSPSAAKTKQCAVCLDAPRTHAMVPCYMAQMHLRGLRGTVVELAGHCPRCHIRIPTSLTRLTHRQWLGWTRLIMTPAWFVNVTRRINIAIAVLNTPNTRTVRRV